MTWPAVAPFAVLLVLALAGCRKPPTATESDAFTPGAPEARRLPPSPEDTSLVPDLVILGNRVTSTMFFDERNFAPAHCAVMEGCLGGTGARKLLRFSTVTYNQGSDIILGVPGEFGPIWEYSPCHDHFHFIDFASYELIDSRRVAVAGHKQAFCLGDQEQIDETKEGPTYTCDFQGISEGWADVYVAALDCQWIDVTDVAPGTYTLRIRINPARVLKETDYSNNDFEREVIIE